MEEVYFKSHSENYCISFVDIIGSTSLVSTINLSENIRRFYSIFINTIAGVLKKHNGKIIKTVGDGVLSYFPLTGNSMNIGAFEQVIDCCFAQIDTCGEINSDLDRSGLARVSYRISADYGKVEIANSTGRLFWTYCKLLFQDKFIRNTKRSNHRKRPLSNIKIISSYAKELYF